MNLHDWIDELCDVLDVDTEVDESLLADLAASASENVGRTAGPVAAYLLGVAVGASDAGPEDAERLAARALDLADRWDRPAAAGAHSDDVDTGFDEVPDDSGVDHASDVYAG